MNSLSTSQIFRNKLLSSLPESDLEILRPHLVPVILELGRILHSPGELVRTVYFLEDGICSSVLIMADGSTVEVGIVGKEGFVGSPAILGTESSLNQTVIQLAGSGFSIHAKTLKDQYANGSQELRRSLHSSIQGLLVQTAQTAACNRVHQIEERLCRWLLMCLDRMGTDYLTITHEFLGVMLGTSRSTVTLALGILESAGLISRTRGRIQVLNRKGLEEASCECYATVHGEYLRLGLL